MNNNQCDPYDQYDQYDQCDPYDQYDQCDPYDQYDKCDPYDQYDQCDPYDQYDQCDKKNSGASESPLCLLLASPLQENPTPTLHTMMSPPGSDAYPASKTSVTPAPDLIWSYISAACSRIRRFCPWVPSAVFPASVHTCTPRQSANISGIGS